jgi:hypothetical protein
MGNKIEIWVKREIKTIISEIRIPKAAKIVVSLKMEKNLENSFLIAIMDMMMKKEISR